MTAIDMSFPPVGLFVSVLNANQRKSQLRMRFRVSTCNLLLAGLLFLVTSFSANAEIVFDELTLGRTENPTKVGQDNWRATIHPGTSFGEIQDTNANGGRAIRQYTDVSDSDAQQLVNGLGHDLSFRRLNDRKEIFFFIRICVTSTEFPRRKDVFSPMQTLAWRIDSLSVGLRRSKSSNKLHQDGAPKPRRCASSTMAA
jgi:hypothetical protein